MEIRRCTIDTRYSSYDELKRRCVVAQGWSASGDLSFWSEEKISDIDSYVELLVSVGCISEGTKRSATSALSWITHLSEKTIVLGTEGGCIRGICEIPHDYCYVYDTDGNQAEYANCLFPVRWVDWNDFCKNEQLQTMSNPLVMPMTNVNSPDLREYIAKNWESFKHENGIDIQPPICAERLQTIKKSFPQRVVESRERFLRMKCESQRMKGVAKMKTQLNRCYNLILTGAPGTGKTHLAREIAQEMILGFPVKDEQKLPQVEVDALAEQIGFCQFHPSMDYTDFVEGLRPVKSKAGNGNIGFERQDGIFMKFCRKAATAQKDNPNEKFVFIIDEINRGDIAKIFGELFFAIDPGYRGVKWKIATQYSTLPSIYDDDVFASGFYVPDNVFIIGTMNDIDRGVESMDFAIRRRFTWHEITPADTQEAILGSAITDASIRGRAQNRLGHLNVAIKQDPELGAAFQIGAAYFTQLEGEKFDELWKYRICPLLREYMRGQEKVRERLKKYEEEFNKEGPLSEADKKTLAF